MNEIIARHGKPDAKAADWLKLMKTAFSENEMPSFLSLKGHAGRNVVYILSTTTCGEGKYVASDFFPDLLDGIKPYLPATSYYFTSRSSF